MDNSEGNKYKHLVPISSMDTINTYLDKIVAFDVISGSMGSPGFASQTSLAFRYAYVTKILPNITWQEDGCYLCEYVHYSATDNLIPITNSFLKKMGLRIRLATNDEKKMLSFPHRFSGQYYRDQINQALAKDQ
ncbi:hypothetical protein Noda2021_03900 [Candidatus Dependentiae bacterium Noda2021]|nr:hypothetical protein Noda2021_03900 [Candidatus Dependentiae bacterium Noda2021]